MRTSFWDPEAKATLLSNGRQDIVDRGDALAERVTALMLMAYNRLGQYMEDGDLYNNKGGVGSYGSDHITDIEMFVNDRLPQEIEALEQILATFDNLDDRNKTKDSISVVEIW